MFSVVLYLLFAHSWLLTLGDGPDGGRRKHGQEVRHLGYADDAVLLIQLQMPSSKGERWRPFSRPDFNAFDWDLSQISAGARDWINEFTANGTLDEYQDSWRDMQVAPDENQSEELNQTWQVVHNLLTMNFTKPKRCTGRPLPHEVNVSRYVMDNSELRLASKGVYYRYSKQGNGNNRDTRSIAFWGSVVQGVNEGDGWLRVGDCYLPMLRNGKRIIHKASPVDDHRMAPVREGLSDPFSQIKAVEAKGIPGGTRITIVTGDAANNTNWTEGRTYHVDINGTFPNMSSYTDALQNLKGQAGTKFHVHLNNATPSSGVYASMFSTINGSHIFIPTGSVVMAADKQPVWEIKQAIADAVQEGIKKAEDAAKRNNTKPTMDAVRKAVQAEVWGTWNKIAKTMLSTRFKRRDNRGAHKSGITTFFKSVPIFDWCVVIVAILIFTMQHYGLLHWPTTRALHGTALILWFVVASLYAILIFKRQGTVEGILWLNGYVLELIFLVENVLVTHFIIHAFRTPKWVNEKALFIVVIARIIFQLIFYMGLAELVFSGEALAYVLGLWLLYIAWQAAADDDDSTFDIMDSRVVHAARAAFGERLWLAKDDSGALFVVKENKRRLSLVGLMVFCLILVDMLLHVDVALTKIEELQGNGYLCFSSAAVASFCLPELVFVIRDLFRTFPGLKYGISGVLLYIAGQMLLHAIFRPPILADLVVFVGCLVFSAMLPALGLIPRTQRSVDAGTQACLTPLGKEGAVCDASLISIASEAKKI